MSLLRWGEPDPTLMSGGVFRLRLRWWRQESECVYGEGRLMLGFLGEVVSLGDHVSGRWATQTHGLDRGGE